MNITTELAAALAGRYVVDREIGRGGMAVVYLARDTKHDRLVAVKVLSPELGAALGAERFLSEIRTTATLQHPNLLPLFDSGEANGLLYYVMPYVEGESLRARLEREQQLPVEDAVRIATGIANALSYAHARGVIHRDLKPENVLLHHGQPVVLDFGIALAVRNAAEGRKTQTGISVGTPQYMSPEQAAGEKVIDGRADIYALGTLTYEMLAGEPPHTGRSAQAIIAKVMAGEVRPVTAVRPSVPAHVASAVQRALARVPADRFPNAAEFARALENQPVHAPVPESAWSASATTPVARVTPASRLMLIAISGVAVLATAAAGWGWGRPAPLLPAMRFDLTVGPAPLYDSDVSISPDGTMLTYSGTIAGDSTAIFIRRLVGEPDFRMLAGTETGRHPVFSPDNQWIVFHRRRDGSLVKVSVSGGGQTTIANNTSAFNPHWGTQGEIVYSGVLGLFVVPATGGAPRRLNTLDGRRPFLLPDGSGVLGTVRRDAVVYDLRTDSITVLVPNARNPVYTSSGHLIYDDDQGGLSAVPFDLERHRVTGTPVRILDRVASDVRARGFSVSDNGTLVQHEGVGDLTDRVPTKLVIRGLDGRADTLPLPSGRKLHPRFSPNGRLVAYTMQKDRGSDVYTYDIARGTNTQITFGNQNSFPIWSPDGTRLVYRKDSSETSALHVKAADNSGADRALVAGVAEDLSPSDWPRGDLILYTSHSVSGMSGDLETISPQPGARPKPYLETPWREMDATLSPDGRYVTFMARESSAGEVWVHEFPTPVGRWRVSPNGGESPRWSPDGASIYYWKSASPGVSGVIDTLWRVRLGPAPALAGRPPELVTTLDAVGPQPWDIHPDGKRFVVVVPKAAAATSDAETPGGSRFVVIVNWFTELNALVKKGSN